MVLRVPGSPASSRPKSCTRSGSGIRTPAIVPGLPPPPPWRVPEKGLRTVRMYCTLRVARRLWPDVPSHANQALRDRLDLNVPGDALVTAALLVREAETAGGIEQLLGLTRQPELLCRVPFGKHRGQPWSEVSQDYLVGAARQDRDNPDLDHTIQASLRGRFVPLSCLTQGASSRTITHLPNRHLPAGASGTVSRVSPQARSSSRSAEWTEIMRRSLLRASGVLAAET